MNSDHFDALNGVASSCLLVASVLLVFRDFDDSSHLFCNYTPTSFLLEFLTLVMARTTGVQYSPSESF